MNRKIFIDCGFYRGSSIVHFKSTPEYSSDFIYYGFDPVLNLEASKIRWPNITLDNKAVWINDGEINFYTSVRHGGKANGVYHNRRAGKENTIKISCIDFSKWIKNNFDLSDYIVLKMDIEGAEYDVIPKMIQDLTIDMIDIIYLEWHAGRTEDSNKSKEIKIMTDLKNKKRLVIRQSLERYLRYLRKKGKL